MFSRLMENAAQRAHDDQHPSVNLMDRLSEAAELWAYGPEGRPRATGRVTQFGYQAGEVLR